MTTPANGDSSASWVWSGWPVSCAATEGARSRWPIVPIVHRRVFTPSFPPPPTRVINVRCVSDVRSASLRTGVQGQDDMVGRVYPTEIRPSLTRLATEGIATVAAEASEVVGLLHRRLPRLLRGGENGIAVRTIC